MLSSAVFQTSIAIEHLSGNVKFPTVLEILQTSNAVEHLGCRPQGITLDDGFLVRTTSIAVQHFRRGDRAGFIVKLAREKLVQFGELVGRERLELILQFTVAVDGAKVFFLVIESGHRRRRAIVQSSGLPKNQHGKEH